MGGTTIDSSNIASLLHIYITFDQDKKTWSGQINQKVSKEV